MTQEYSKETLVQVISWVQEKLAQNCASEMETVRDILSGVVELLTTVKLELDTSTGGFPESSGELAAAIRETEDATNTIIDSAMDIQTAVNASTDETLAETVNGKTTAILEACAFQDITGQRINKVIGHIDRIESDLTRLLALLTNARRPEGETSGDASLMNGPQLPDNAISQEEIDELLSQLDS